MTARTLAAATLLVLVPGLAMAMGCGYEHKTQEANQCLIGQVYDPATGNCVTPQSS